MSVRAFVSACVYVCTYMHVHICTYMYACTHVCMYICTHVRICMYMLTFVHVWRSLCAYMCIYIHVRASSCRQLQCCWRCSCFSSTNFLNECVKNHENRIEIETSIFLLDILGYMGLKDCYFLIFKFHSISTGFFNSGNKKI